MSYSSVILVLLKARLCWGFIVRKFIPSFIGELYRLSRLTLIDKMYKYHFPICSEVLSAQSVLESVEDIASAEETPVSELAQKVLNQWSTLREAYRIPKKERIQQMKEHEREADQNVVKPRPRRLPLYAEKMRDRYEFCYKKRLFLKLFTVLEIVLTKFYFFF